MSDIDDLRRLVDLLEREYREDPCPGSWDAWQNALSALARAEAKSKETRHE